MNHANLIDQYVAGPRQLREAIDGMFQRRVKHSEADPITLEQLLANITNHIPHHVKFIQEKRAAM